jgi:hypothetical protein
MIPANQVARNGFYHPRLNGHGTDTIGYQVYRDGGGNYRIVNGAVASMVLVDWQPSYSEALRLLRCRERRAWGK